MTLTPETAKRHLEAVCLEFARHGLIVNIRQHPLPALAMGHYETVVDVRPARTNPVLVRVGQCKQTEDPKSFAETHPANPQARCKCEHWQSCAECHPTAHVGVAKP